MQRGWVRPTRATLRRVLRTGISRERIGLSPHITQREFIYLLLVVGVVTGSSPECGIGFDMSTIEMMTVLGTLCGLFALAVKWVME